MQYIEAAIEEATSTDSAGFVLLDKSRFLYLCFPMIFCCFPSRQEGGRIDECLRNLPNLGTDLVQIAMTGSIDKKPTMNAGAG